MRLSATFILTLACISALQYYLASRPVETTLVVDARKSAEAQATAVKDAYLAHKDPAMSLMMANAIVAGMTENPHTSEALLLDPGGRVVAGRGVAEGSYSEATQPTDMAGMHHDGAMAGMDGAAAPTESDPSIARARKTGRTAVARSSDPDHAFQFSVPIDLPAGRFVLHVAKDRFGLDSQLASLRERTLLLLVLGLPLGTLVFYLFGGRSLAGVHRRTLESSTRDPLTGLANHRLFHDDLDRTVRRATASGGQLALGLIDIDEFKQVNDRSGHRRGDAVLGELAALMQELLPGDHSYRIGGDEFALLLVDTDVDEARETLERLREAVALRLSTVTISAGVASLATAAGTTGDLIDRADAALYEVKRQGRNAVLAFDEIAHRLGPSHPAQERALRALLAEDRMDVAFQPIWDLTATSVLGYEALARIPTACGLTGPQQAFEVAARSGSTAALDALCRRAVLARAGELPSGALLFLNVSPAVVGHESCQGDALVAAVQAAGLTPQQVVLELTERGIGDRDAVVAELTDLRRLGFRIALDDVGAGDAGLELLRRMSVDYVKIDREVVAAALSDTAARAVLLAIVAFARETGTFVIAEGIETDAMLRLVDELGPRSVALPGGIQGAQGYLLGRPAPAPRTEPPASPELSRHSISTGSAPFTANVRSELIG